MVVKPVVLLHELEDAFEQLQRVLHQSEVAPGVASFDIGHDLFHDVVYPSFLQLRGEAGRKEEVKLDEVAIQVLDDVI